MGKKLIIAEKPSVAADIARALGGFTRKSDYFESDEYVLSSAVGHLLELVLPEQHDVKKGKWSFAKLPVIPPHFDLAPIERSEDRLNLLQLNEHTCKWPIGDPLTPDFYFCGQHSDEGKPYCEFHSRRAYHQLEKKKR